ncbi:NUDIX domain-containing protein [Pelagibacterium limicola]|uniref:NUDIX domain-containing protein n=1 Tax=Pelagibacterium limicola TaxID=2791022 RepID=UPI0018AFF03B|nr:NUDIX domain-containing protein [Pelagibacterium limicola]
MVSHWQRLKFGLMLRAIGIYKHMTLGARCAVIVDGKVLLVRHGYDAGWHFPGGGVDPGETVEEAARREVLEETGYAVEGHVQLFGIYHSRHYTNRDHVTFFVARAAHKERDFVSGYEIAEIGWFALDAPPAEISPATARRLAEIAGTADKTPVW